MPKQRLPLLGKSFDHLKSFFLALGFALLIIFFQGQLIPAVSSSPQPLLLEAQKLTEQGHKYLRRGNAAVALQTWQQAIKIYQELGNEEGVKGTKINQSLALQALGKYRQACQVLQDSLRFDVNSKICEPFLEEKLIIPEQPTSKRFDVNSKICEPSLEEKLIIPEQSTSKVSVIGLRTLGDTLRVIGKLEASETVLEKSRKMAKFLQDDQELDKTLLSLGNTVRSQYNRQKDLYDRSDSTSDRDQAIEYADCSAKYYQKIAQKQLNSKDYVTLIQAKVNHLSLLIDYEKWLKEIKNEVEAASTQAKIQAQLANLAIDQPLILQLPPVQSNIYLLLNLSQSLSQINQSIPAFNYAKQALTQAQKLQDRRNQAYALSRLGNLYEINGQLADAELLSRQGLGLANSMNDASISYQIKWQLARIYQKTNKFNQALEFYDSAIESLDAVRKNLLSVNPDAQFSFRNNIKPIYQEYLELILSQAQIPQKNLEKLIQISESLQLAQLENFLRCDTAELKSIDKVETPPVAIIYPIILKDRIEVIIKIPQSKLTSLSKLAAKEIFSKRSSSQLYRYTTQVPQTVLEQEIESLQNYLSDQENSSENPLLSSAQPENSLEESIPPSAQKMYKWLLRQAEADLPKSGTLVFVTNSSLQTIPMAVLHDGEKYLVEKYSITMSLGSQLHSVNPLKPGKWSVLLAGISEKAEIFPTNLPALPGVRVELRNIGKKVSHYQLLNQNFTVNELREQVNGEDFPVIHLATHGQFSSRAENTFIYAWDKKIKVFEFDRILQRRGQVSREPIHLIVLSACETAKGDKQAALGLAGVALRARARSVIASLWKVSDRPTAMFMEYFYEQLNQGKTKAEALQNTQINFIKNQDLGYRKPYYWSAFVLAGNWL